MTVDLATRAIGIDMGAPMKAMYRILSIVLNLTLISIPPVFAESFWDRFKDPSDGKVDFSGWSKEEEKTTGGFLPVPIFVSEPAVGGFGLGAVLLYIREKGPYENPKSDSGKEGKQRPPSITAVAGAYTLNDSWALAAGHQNNWFSDSLRYSGGLGYVSLKLDFYGIGQGPDLTNRGESSIDFNIEGFLTLHDLRYRLLKTDLSVHVTRF